MVTIIKFHSKHNSITLRSVYVFACCAALNSVLLGYDIGVMSGAVLYIKETFTLTDFQVCCYCYDGYYILHIRVVLCCLRV